MKRDMLCKHNLAHVGNGSYSGRNKIRLQLGAANIREWLLFRK